MPDLYKNGLRHATTLASGRTLAPGEVVDPADLDLSPGSHDQDLVDDESLIEGIVSHEVLLSGRALDERARELGVEGRSSLSADELRAAVAEAEAGAGDQER